jgi:hypothetical protein
VFCFEIIFKNTNAEVVSKAQVVFEGKASIRFESGAYMPIREHFKANRNAAIGHKMGF